MNRFFIAAVAAVALYSPAQAAAPQFTWTGLYIGGHGGYAWARDSFALTGGTNFGSETFSPRGGFGGFQVGYNRQIAGTPFVFGTEIDMSWGKLRDDGTVVRAISGPRDAHVQIDHFGTGRFRAGYAFDRTLIFGSFGVAWSRNEAGLASEASTNLFNGYHVGWAAGIGVEQAIDSHWSVKLEYLHADLGLNERPLSPALPTNNGSETKLSMDLVRAGVNYRFGAMGDARARMPAGGAASAPLWTGSYLGVHAGYTWLTSSYTDVFAPAESQHKLKGGLVGFQSGYNWQFTPSWLVGIESDFSFLSAENTANSNLLSSGAKFGTTTVKIDKIGTMRGRFGFIADRVLVYGTGGLAYAQVDVAEVTNSGNNVSGVKGYQVGAVYGGGIEYAVTPHWSVKTEYLRTNFSADRFHASVDVSNQLSQKTDTVKVGLNYHGLIERVWSR